jgi:signal transduction histidine kinase
VVALKLVYLPARTVIAWKDPYWLPWQYVFPPIDVALVSLILFLSHRGPMSNITLLFFLPMVQASGSLNVRWAAAVGLMVVLGTALSAYGATDLLPSERSLTVKELIQQDPLNVVFRIYFLVVLSSLMAYQAAIAAGLKERLAVSADRNRIAMDMHDGVQGHLIALSSQLELLARVASKDGARAVELAEEGRESARQAADELRFLVQRLRAPALEDGFVPALRQYAHNLCERHGLRLEFKVEGKEQLLEPEVENALFRIAQESITNVVKHAAATQVEVCVTYMGHHAELVVEDDGRGFGAVREGVGLVGIRERAERAGGRAEVKSEPGVGTRVLASF